MVSDWKWISGISEVVITDGQTLLYKCEGASKNDQEMFGNDWRWGSGIFEVALTDRRTKRPS